ncbi:2-octaprenyl-6-methoxyphenyl hydroxylase [Marinimicrobium sp. ABcell2]|uniref:2-octaprenyl-6-methoxyphenyl hydroxylase n=1 Tax=Marinimicrobium sp. ABcell2 TaxID=3069751 RepID=UPI0027B84B3A|nr:2-octaprenyl-6-methoxyphenyl hydroxylase [Marinimicrobium sp. ABcell2]MDQ2076138.1 2-octaprenyl-6-methoxyphenyl hydroxylase [Marinimicrobium sp. ABcell2]
MSAPDFDIAIVGGGLVGASLASLLAAGEEPWRIALIDAKGSLSASTDYQPDYDHRSTAVSSGSAEILDRLGIWKRLRQHATAIRRVHVSDRGHLGGANIDADEQRLDALGYVIENAWLAPLLLEWAQNAEGVTSLMPMSVQTLEPGRGHARLTLASPEGGEQTLTAALVVVAEGSNSPLRKALGIETRIVDYRQSAVIANVSFTEPHQSVAYERFTGEGPLALLPLDESPQAQRAALVWTLPPHRAEQLRDSESSVFLAALQERFGWRLGRFQKVGERQLWPLRLLMAEEQIRSNVVLMGNAAHSLHPVAGQGFNLALRDCARLAEVLIHARRRDKSPGELPVLEDYLALQKRDQALTINLSDQLVRLFTSTDKPQTAARHLGLLGLDLLPPVKAQFAAQTMGTAGSRARWLEGSL